MGPGEEGVKGGGPVHSDPPKCTGLSPIEGGHAPVLHVAEQEVVSTLPRGTRSTAGAEHHAGRWQEGAGQVAPVPQRADPTPASMRALKPVDEEEEEGQGEWKHGSHGRKREWGGKEWTVGR